MTRRIPREKMKKCHQEIEPITLQVFVHSNLNFSQIERFLLRFKSNMERKNPQSQIRG